MYNCLEQYNKGRLHYKKKYVIFLTVILIIKKYSNFCVVSIILYFSKYIINKAASGKKIILKYVKVMLYRWL